MDYELNYKQYQKLREEQDMLKRRVNQKVEAMSDKVEKEFITLIERKKEIEQNKVDLFQDMEELDQKRKVVICSLTSHASIYRFSSRFGLINYALNNISIGSDPDLLLSD
jgi:hypothetical protein